MFHSIQLFYIRTTQYQNLSSLFNKTSVSFRYIENLKKPLKFHEVNKTKYSTQYFFTITNTNKSTHSLKIKIKIWAEKGVSVT